MMHKIKYILPLIILVVSMLSSCKKDDDGGPVIVPPRDRGPEAIRAQDSIEQFLETHFYNYEEFQTPPLGFDYKIVFDTIAGDNADKIPLMEQVEFKNVLDRIDESVTYKFYYLNVNEGGGERPHFTDVVINSYEGRLLDLELFDSSTIPVRFDLTQVVEGYQAGIIEFNGAEQIINNPDGSLSFENYGIGAIFVPAGLGYYNFGAPGISAYEQLIFTFQLYESEIEDHDSDGIPSFMEDLNDNGYELDDDTDNDNIPNYADVDDDNDGRPTRDEIEIDDEGNITFPDVDGDGVPDYLDEDN